MTGMAVLFKRTHPFDQIIGFSFPWACEIQNLPRDRIEACNFYHKYIGIHNFVKQIFHNFSSKETFREITFDSNDFGLFLR
jgi:hypothetical protein